MDDFQSTNSLPITDTATLPSSAVFSISTDEVKPKKKRLNIKSLLLNIFKREKKQHTDFSTDSSFTPAPRSKQNMSFKFKKGPAILAIVAILILAGFLFFALRGGKSSNVVAQSTTDERPSVKAPRATANLNKEFAFPINDDKGKEVTKLKYVIDTADLQDEIIVQGKKFVAVQGKTILVLNLKLTNTFDKPIKINTIDFVRLFAGNSPDSQAPDYNSDPVTVQPISTKEVRIGYPVKDTDHTFKLKVGPITGNKTDVDFQL